jgi:uncharacterized protein (DUF427 family)
MKELIRIEPTKGQISVWDFPQSPLVEDIDQQIRVYYKGLLIANTTQSKRVLEKAHPPCYYIPMADIQMHYLKINGEISFCQYKGKASYFNLEVGTEIITDLAWTYLKPTSKYTQLTGYVAFFAGKGCDCYVGEELASPQPSEFFGGWITADIVGPFKGEDGTWDW